MKRRSVFSLITVAIIILVLVAVVQAAALAAAETEEEQPVLFLPLLRQWWVTPANCPVGLHLTNETAPLIVSHQQTGSTVSVFTYLPAETYFPGLNNWQRLIVQPSLEGVETKAQRALENGVPYEALVYAPDARESTPEEEWKNLVVATQAARGIADAYGKELYLAPGIILMSENPENYPPMAALADGWFIDTRVFQNANPPGELYRWDVATVVERVRAGNASIPIWAQIGLEPIDPDVATWIAYWDALHGLVKNGDVMASFGGTDDPDELLAAIEALFVQLCEAPAP